MLSDDAITEFAPAKLNLALHVRARRDDGYHELETLFAFATGGDVVTVAPAEADTLAVTGPFAPALAEEGDNLVSRASSAFTARFAPGARHAVALEKNLPVASGIGGGSADAAAALRALARLHDVAAGDPELLAIARALGADVPACLLGRTAFGSGRGDDLRPLPPLGDLPALLVNPGVGVSTAAVFAYWDGIDRGPLTFDGDPLERARAGRNDLEAPAIGAQPVIAEVLAALAATAPTFARMSGSGATCFALYATPGARHAAAARVATAHPGWWVWETALA